MDQETITVELTGAHKGQVAVFTADPDWGFAEDLIPSDDEDFKVARQRMAEALLRHLISWTVRDWRGQELALTLDGIKRVPQGQIRGMIRSYVAAYQTLPNSPGDDSSPTSSTSDDPPSTEKAPRPRLSTGS